MQTVTLSQLLEGANPNGQIYVLRDGDAVLYVGMTRTGIHERWCNQFSGRLIQVNGKRFRAGGDKVSRLIRDRHPSSMEWQLDCYTIDELRAAYEPHKDAIESNGWLELSKWGVDDFERFVIAVKLPILNVTHNAESPLIYPAWWDEWREQAAEAQLDTLKLVIE